MIHVFQASGTTDKGISGTIAFTPLAGDPMVLTFSFGKSAIQPTTSGKIQADLSDELQGSTYKIFLTFKTVPH